MEKENKITQENFESTYQDEIEVARIDKFVCDEMARQIHRYIKAMKGSKQIMLKFEESMAGMTVEQKEEVIAKYIDINRKAISGLDFKIVLARSMANYCDTFAYLVHLVNDKRKMVFLRTCYVYVDDLKSLPVIAQKDGKMGLVMPDGNDTVVAPFEYDDISLRDEYPYFEAVKEGVEGVINSDGRFQGTV